MVLALLLAPAWASSAPAARAVWWGPTGMLEGWHVRVPVAVTNPNTWPLLDATVGYDLALREALLQSGWTASGAGPGAKLQSFELDPGSVRIVEYQALGTDSPTEGLLVGEVASRARMGFLERSGTFNNRTSPDLHVEWVLPGELKPGATRYFMVYVDATMNGAKPPAAYAEPQTAPLDARYWIGRGTTLYGLAAGVILIGMENDTLVHVEAYQHGKPRLVEVGSGSSFQNPLLLQRGETVQVNISTTPGLVRILSDRPVLALSPGGNNYIVGPIPSVDGNVRGKIFELLAQPAGYIVVAPEGGATVTRTPHDDPTRAETFTLTPGMPVMGVGYWTTSGRESLRATEPVLVLSYPLSHGGKMQYPSAWGAPVGSRIVALPSAGSANDPDGSDGADWIPSAACRAGHVQYTNSGLIATAFGNATYLRGRDLATLELRYPLAPSGQVSETASLVEPGLAWRPQSRPDTCPTLFHATSSPADTVMSEHGRLAVFGGATPSKDAVFTPVGGERATEFHVFWDAYVVAYHNATQVSIRQDGRTLPSAGLGRGDVVEVTATSVKPATLVATKPVLVLPRVQSTSFLGAYFAGIDESLVVRPAGAPEYRGYLVSLAPDEGATDPLVGLAAPGKPLTYTLVVTNLAKDHRGTPVPDTIRLGLSPSLPGWTASLSETTLRLDGGASRRVTLTVTPPPDAEDGVRQTLTVAAASEGNPLAVDRLQVVTLVRASFGVDVWFDRENGPRTRTLTLDPDSAQPVQVVVKNTASVPDRILVKAAALSDDWQVRFDGMPGALLEIPLNAGETRELTLRVASPPDNASQSLLELSAASLSDAGAEKKISATLRVRADIRIALRADEPTVEALPGEEARFRVVFHNRGSDQVSIRFNTTGALPEGWTRPVTYQSGFAIDELSGIAPGGELPIDVVVRIPDNATRSQRANLHFFVETIPQFVGDPTLRETLDLLALVGARHDLRPVNASAVVPLGLLGDVRPRLTLENRGNGDEELRVIPRKIPEGASLLVGAATVIAQDGRGAVSFQMQLDGATPAGVHPVEIDLVARDGYVVPWAFNVSVPERPLVAWKPAGPLVGIAGVASSVRLEVVNGGNVPVPLPPRFAAPEGWRIQAAHDTAVLGPGRTALVELSILAPRDAPPQRYDLAPLAGWAEAEPLAWDLRTVDLQPSLLDGEGDARSVAVRVANRGTGDALDIEVVLVREGAVVDRVVLQRIAPDGEATALLAAPQGSAGAFVVRVDEAGRYLPAPAEIAVTLEPAGNRIPGPGAWAILVVGLAVLLLRRD